MKGDYFFARHLYVGGKNVLYFQKLAALGQAKVHTSAQTMMWYYEHFHRFININVPVDFCVRMLHDQIRAYWLWKNTKSSGFVQHEGE